MMKKIVWNLLKSERLKKTRGVSFDEIIQGKFVGEKKHPTKEHQRLLLFEYKNYIWVVPCVESANEVFLKTLFPSRKYTHAYKRGEL